jgi:hypothetical protein
MKPTKPLSLCALLVMTMGASVSASAQPDATFTGPAVGIYVSSISNKAEYGQFLAGKSSSTNGSDAKLAATYGFELSPDWLGTVALEYGLREQDVGSVQYNLAGAQTVTAKLKDHWSLSFAPGYRLGRDSQIYAKLALHQITAAYTDTAGADGTSSQAGTGFGLGYAKQINTTFEWRAEYESVTYESAKVKLSTGEPRQDAFSLGVLFHF